MSKSKRVQFLAPVLTLVLAGLAIGGLCGCDEVLYIGLTDSPLAPESDLGWGWEDTYDPYGYGYEPTDDYGGYDIYGDYYDYDSFGY